MRLFLTFIAVLAIIFGVIFQTLPLALLGAAGLMLIDPLRPRGETTADAMFDYDGYERRAVERSHERTTP